MTTILPKTLIKMALQPGYAAKYFEMRRLQHLPRYTPTSTLLLNRRIQIVDAASFLFMCKEIFEQGIYRFKARSSSPRIIDGGANIGLSIVYFKQIYPQSKIIAFEPDHAVFQVLSENINSFAFEDVTLLQKALWNSEDTLEFMAEGADGGRVVELEEASKVVKVQAVRLRKYLEDYVDFLKLDIEGAETEVIEDCQDLLVNVGNLFIEYHSFAKCPQTLDRLIHILAKSGFRLHIHPPVTSPQPFYVRNVHMGMDMQLNIFAFRE